MNVTNACVSAPTAAYYLGLRAPSTWTSRRVPLGFDANTYHALHDEHPVEVDEESVNAEHVNWLVLLSGMTSNNKDQGGGGVVAELVVMVMTVVVVMMMMTCWCR